MLICTRLLCELCKLPVPAEQLSGQSFAGVFKNLKAKTKGEVYIQWEGGANAVDRRYSYAGMDERRREESQYVV